VLGRDVLDVLIDLAKQVLVRRKLFFLAFVHYGLDTLVGSA
jgi:hypothetical protein